MPRAGEAAVVLFAILSFGLATVFIAGGKGSAPAAKASCVTPTECQYFEVLQKALGRGQGLSAFRLDPPCEKCRRADFGLEALGQPHAKPMSTGSSAKFSHLLSESSSYVLGGAKKAMPFVADYGVQIGEDRGRTVLLLSSSSKSVRLLAVGLEPIVIMNIDPVADRVFAEMESALR